MRMQSEYPISLVYQVLGLARCSFYYPNIEKDETDDKAAIEQLAGEWPTYGYGRITKQLHRQGKWSNSKRVRRLMSELDFLQVNKQQKPPTTTRSNHSFQRYPNLVKDLDVVRPNHVWVSDITYVRLLHEFVYLAVIMDVFTRSLPGWHLGPGLDQALTLSALKRALNCGHRPEIHHSDHGVQYVANAYVDTLTALSAAISMAAVGQANQTPFAELVIRTIKEEEVYVSDYQDYQDAYQQIGQFIEAVYQHKRTHSSLGYLTPNEFEAQWLETHTQVEVVH